VIVAISRRLINFRGKTMTLTTIGCARMINWIGLHFTGETRRELSNHCIWL
jgi:hypothetical protein